VGFVDVKSVLGRVLKQWNISPAEVDAYAVFHVWGEIVGEQVASRSRPSRISDRRLFVEVDDPLWLTQLKYMRVSILDRIGERIGRGIIYDVRFFLKGFR
jgi:predicted nucleic acid-binding Zn ribbon protein